jgi:outer membrane protein
MSFPRASISHATPLAWALALAFCGTAAQAQSLTAVVDAARSYDATYLGARASADAAHYRYEQSRSNHLPSANLVVTGGRQNSESPTAVTATTDVQETAHTTSGGATINAAQTIFNRQNDLSIDEAQKQEDISLSQLRQAEQDLIVRVSQAYFNVLAAADALQSVLGNGKSISEQLASAKRNFEVGNATITDTREAEARSDLSRSQQISAENDLQVAKVTLDQLVGRNGVAPRPLALPAVLPPVMPSQVSDWIALAESDSPGLKQTQLALEIAQLETERAKAGHLPTLVANATYGRGRVRQSYDYGGTSGSLSGPSNSSGVSVTLTVPLFAGFAIQNRVRETVALEQKARTDADGARNSVVLGTRTAFLGAQTQAAQVKALEAAESSSKLALDATQLGYKVGVKVNLDVLNAQSQLYSTQRDLAAARYNYLVSTLKLRQTAGTLTTNDLLAIDALLVK